jgi:hypothetical protein
VFAARGRDNELVDLSDRAISAVNLTGSAGSNKPHPW